MASRIALKPCSLGRPSLAGSGRCGRTQSHSSSDRSVGYLVLSIAQSVGHHHVWAQFPDSLSTLDFSHLLPKRVGHAPRPSSRGGHFDAPIPERSSKLTRPRKDLSEAPLGPAP